MPAKKTAKARKNVTTTRPQLQVQPETLRMSASQVATLRDLFWHNVVRDMLNGLSMLTEKQPELFDGRFGVLTNHGERVPIGHIQPVFALSVPSKADKDCSLAVQCTVFRIQTPGGEVFTLPVHEIRGLHALTPELVDQLQKIAEEEAERESEETGSGPARPFGFAAFAALPKMIPVSPFPAPEHPTE